MYAGSNGEARVELRLDDRDFSVTHDFAPNQLVPADIRELRLIRVWYDVLSARTFREVAKVDKLLSEYTEGD